MNARNKSEIGRYVTDQDGAKACAVGVNTFRRLAREADAVVKIGKIKRNDLPKIYAFIENNYTAR